MLYKDAIELALKRPGAKIRRTAWPNGLYGALDEDGKLRLFAPFLEQKLAVFLNERDLMSFLSEEDTKAADWEVYAKRPAGF